MRKGFLQRSFVLIVLGAFMMVLPAGTAFAQSHTVQRAMVANCGGTCYNKDPYTYYNGVRCSDTDGGAPANAYGFFDKSGYKLLTIQNWYSTGCQTNWIVAYLQGNTDQVLITLDDNALGQELCYPEKCGLLYTGTASPLWTNMLVAPTTTACAGAYVHDIRLNKYLQTPGEVACA